jgi:hypothetical protein
MANSNDIKNFLEYCSDILSVLGEETEEEAFDKLRFIVETSKPELLFAAAINLMLAMPKDKEEEGNALADLALELIGIDTEQWNEYETEKKSLH